MSSKNSGLLRIFFIGLALILFGVLVGVVAARFLPMPNNSVNISPTPSPTDIIVPTTTDPPISTVSATPTTNKFADWKTYTNTFASYSLMYPPNWKVLDLSEGMQVEIYYQPDKTKSVGELLIEKISQFPPDVSQYTDEKMIGSITAKCKSDATVKTWCYLDLGENAKVSIYIEKDKDADYNITLDQILSTLKYINKDSSEFTCPSNGWRNCMPVLDEAAQKACTVDAIAWYIANCPGFKGTAL